MRFIFLLCLFCSVCAGQAQKLLLHCGRVIDGKSNKVSEQVTIVVEGERITAVDKGYTTGGLTDSVIDLTGKTVLPGLIDMHVHLEGETSKNGMVERFTMNPADIAFRSTIFARRTLLAGFTTVRDLGGSGVNNALRDAIKKGWVTGIPVRLSL